MRTARIFPIVHILFVCCAVLLLATAGCKKQTPAPGQSRQEEEKKLYNPHMADCNGFTAADAAAILELPAPKMKTEITELYAGNWQCAFNSEEVGKIVSFNVSVSKSVEDAARDMAQYRSHLETAGSTAPFKENLPKGAYSDIGGLGDDGVWTDINLSLAIRQGNVTIQVSMPKDKTLQMKIAQKFLSTLK